VTTDQLMSFLDIELATGRTTRVTSSECSFEDAMACLYAYISAQHQFVPVPTVGGCCLDGYNMTARVMSSTVNAGAENSAIVFINGPNDLPVLTFAISRPETAGSCGAPMWDLLINTAKTPLRAPACPSESWVAWRPEIGAEDNAAAVPALLAFQRALAWVWLDSRNVIDAQQRVREIQAKFLSRIPAPAPAMDGASYREQYEALLRVSVEDALDGLPPFPRLPACLEDPVALDNWGRAWDCWVADQAVKCQRPWLQPATPAMLAAFVETERRLRQRPGELDCPSELEAALGREMPQNDALANRWFTRPAEHGNPSAQRALGYSYETGRGVAVSLPKAVELYEAAAKAGDAQGQHNYAHMLQNGFGVERNLSAAARWYRAAAEQGLAVAQDNLATMYMHGSGVEKDRTEAVRWRRKAAEQGLANAQCDLAWMYVNGVGIERDPTEALRWYQAAAEQGLAVAQDNLARMYIDGAGVEKDLTEAVRWRRKAAEQGFANAQCDLAWMYVNGVGVEKSPTEALRWYQAAAEQGLAVAQDNLARMYMDGAGVEKDLTEAVRWRRKAAEQGFANAQCGLAWMYVNGVGVEKSDTEALHWYQAAAEQGLASAQTKLAWMYATGSAVTKDLAKALAFYKRAADQGHADAQHNLAWMYVNGVGIERDPTEALRWYQAAAEQGLAVAQDNLATMYMDGSGVEKDLTEAVRWRRKAAQQGLANAQYNLAWMYLNGVGVDKNPAEAFRWYQAAAEQGLATAQSYLAWMHFNGVGVDEDAMEAFRWYQAAAEQGLAVAQDNLAKMYMEGAGVEKDLTEAVRWRRKAADQGHADAQEGLAWMYLNGVGVDKNPAEAFRWYQAAAEQGLANAQYNLAWMYVNGVGIERDPTEALRWCQAAAEQGHTIAQRELPVYLADGNQQRELTEARNALNTIEVRLRATDPSYEAKKALLMPILKPIFAQMPPSKWAPAFEEAYAGVQLPIKNTASKQSETGAASQASAAAKKMCPKGSMTVLLYELPSHPGEMGISKIDPPVVDGAFLLDFSRPLKTTRRCFEITNSWIGTAVESFVPVIHQGEQKGNYLIHMYPTDPRFTEVHALWQTRYPSPRTAPTTVAGGLKIIADFATQFPHDC